MEHNLVENSFAAPRFPEIGAPGVRPMEISVGKAGLVALARCEPRNRSYTTAFNSALFPIEVSDIFHEHTPT